MLERELLAWQCLLCLGLGLLEGPTREPPLIVGLVFFFAFDLGIVNRTPVPPCNSSVLAFVYIVV